ncbi:MAG: carbohydrate kinase family protein [Firmicutes bacterium]|nr:carbohydrate kinase family protein [Bacillota bacterium]
MSVNTVLGLGAAAMDTVIGCDRLPQEDSFQVIDREQLLPGGSCANMLAALAALGVRARLLAKIGDDERGRLFRSTLRQDGVEDGWLVEKPGGVTLHTYIWAAATGNHCIFVNLGDALMDLQPEEIDESILDGVDLFYSDFFPGKATLKIARMCKKKDIPVVLCMQCTPSFMRKAGNTDADLEASLALADLIVSGREPYEEYSGLADMQQALAAVYEEYRPRFGAVCTAGDCGAIWLQEGKTLHSPAFSIVPVDSTGAGDSFLGGLIYAFFHEGQSAQAALEFAAAVGAMKCLRFGPRIKAHADEVKRFMREHAK